MQENHFAKDGDIHALLGMYSDELIDSQIAYAKEMFAEGKATALTGVPIVLKDNIVVKANAQLQHQRFWKTIRLCMMQLL
jgi:Asp-tRNA(Asn)/Glu-tRNA(Gln) amidotransferase A subunit family amidase